MLEQCVRVRVLSGTFRVVVKINFRRTHSSTVYMASQVYKAPEMTEEEINVLLDEYSKRRRIIDSGEKTVDFGRKWNRAWEEITETVNACGSFKRTIGQVKTKMKN